MAKKPLIFETPFDTYTSTEVIGEGGSGFVHSVTNGDGEIFAIKRLSPERVTTEKSKRFKNEISFCQKNHHENIVRLIDTGLIIVKDVKCPFYVMPKYSGTLRTLLDELEQKNALTFFSQILDGVEAAHLLGVWHRDLKPENILWNKENNTLVVADFGIAHFEEEEIHTAVETKIASRMANFQYSAPEQRARNGTVDHRADIYSLGLMLNELFTKEVIQGAGHVDIASTHPEYGYLDSIVESMIQQNPENRPVSIDVIKKELIGRKNEFIARQKYDSTKKKVIKTSEVSEFEPISIIGLDFLNGALHLELNKNIPPGWQQEFQNPRGGHSSIMGYGPENFTIAGNKLTLPVREDENLIQKIINHAKQYVTAANNGYILKVKDNNRQKEQRQKADLEKEVAEAELRKNILTNVKL